MAKSTGNFFTIADVLKKHHPEVIRYFLLSSHYRSPLNYSEENLLNANKALLRLYQAIKEIDCADQEPDQAWITKFVSAMNDDFNTPEALSVLFQLSHEINKTKSPMLAATLKQLAEILGLLQESPELFLQAGLADEDKEVIEKLIEQRNEARQNRAWARADEIRQLLLEQGIELEDGPQGTTWRRL
ncbi:cysteinyl-tRNA synthetase [Legionella oakridgensis ATCC 33761 = DSM 21215]|uniref:Cysteine--tRNA ligase n=2 Tax=Legionella oakridgensis TaxID=29423 RepID=W0BAD0_9GAMM|nr:cysteinyl-tRNA synthetase [Legionella oakridgensis ATCC 33761 = DSM 21215]